MRSFNYKQVDQELFTPEIMNLIFKIYEYKGKQELFMEAKPDMLEALLEVTKIQSTGSSNRIEGIFTSDARLKDLVYEKAEPFNRYEEQIAGYRDVLNTIHENYNYIKISSNIILQLYRDLYSYHPSSNCGKYKNQDNTIEEINVNGERTIRFKPLSALETPSAMERLCQAYQDAKKEGRIDSLILISKFILDFLCIHPFIDGNGRMSRLLTLLLLYQEDYIVGKYISIEMIIENTKKSYYRSLQQSSQGWHDGRNSLDPFVKYYLSIILKAYKEFSERVEAVEVRGLNKSERVKDLFDKKIGKISKSHIAEIYPDISIPTIEKALSDLLKAGYIRKVGSGRATAYIRKRD